MRVILFILSVLLPLSLAGQNFTRFDFNRHTGRKSTAADTNYYIETDYPATGLVVNIHAGDSFCNSTVITGSDTMFLTEDEHSDIMDDRKNSNLLSFSSPIDSFWFDPGGIEHEVRFFLINAETPDSLLIKKKPVKKNAGCSEPGMIDQSFWRAGLPEPEYTRINHQVYHLIIHHTAGSNKDTNYVQVIRNIYVYHTQINGWSDIGYNYLIAQDGTLYKGRDPGAFEQDNVKGAHFCGANTGTMGISILGTYIDVAPDKEALESLVSLVTWKLGKESFDPMGTFPHVLDPDLPVISGHRDGCATICPGDSLYSRLDSIRFSVLERFNDCGYVISGWYKNGDLQGSPVIFIRNDELYIRGMEIADAEIRIVDLTGKQHIVKDKYVTGGEIGFNIDFLTPGFYIIKIKAGNSCFSEKFVIPYRQ